MKVIYAGYAKTGTQSMTSAFRTLGFKTYDWMEHYWYHRKEWAKIWEKGSTVEDFRAMYADVDAITGGPAYFFWEQILEAFPDAKVILPVRDDKKWYMSFKEQVHQLTIDKRYILLLSLTPSGLLFFLHQRKTRKMFGSTDCFPWSYCIFNSEVMRKIYRQHNLYVQTKCPKEQFLLFHIKDGWTPVCDFLGVPIPTQEFPYKNKGSSLIGDSISVNPLMIRLEKELHISLSIITIIIAIIIARLFWF